MCDNPKRQWHGRHARGTSLTIRGGACKTRTHRRLLSGRVPSTLVQFPTRIVVQTEELTILKHNLAISKGLYHLTCHKLTLVLFNMYPTSCLYTSLQNISKKYKLISSLSAEVGPEG